MKKTLVTMLALAGCSLAVEENVLSLTQTSLSLEEVTSAQLAEISATNATVALTLDVNAMKDISGVNFAGTSEAYAYFKFTGTWGDGTSGELGACNAGSSGDDTTGVYALQRSNNKNSYHSISGLYPLFDSSTNWDTIDSMSLVCSMVTNESGQVSMTSAFSIRHTDGSITTYGGNSAVIRKGSTDGFTASGVIFDTNFVTSSTTYRGALSLADARALSVQLVPEPTTATLSLLALAGLAARRRRR